MSAWKHNALADDLAGYLSSPERMIWTDMQLGPSGSPRPDVYSIRKSYSKPQPMAFECKISRSDLRSDTTSGKWQTYLKYASGVVFAVPDGLATAGDIPEGCGLIVRKAKEWRYVRRPTLRPVQVPFDACMKLLIDGVNRTYARAQPVPRKVETWRMHEGVRARFGEAVALAAKDLAAAQSRLAVMQAQADADWDLKRKEIERQAQLLKNQFAHEEASWAALRNELLDWLEMERGSLFGVQQRINKLRAECNADARVADAEAQIERARKSVEAALSQFPNISSKRDAA